MLWQLWISHAAYGRSRWTCPLLVPRPAVAGQSGASTTVVVETEICTKTCEKAHEIPELKFFRRFFPGSDPPPLKPGTWDFQLHENRFFSPGLAFGALKDASYDPEHLG